MITVTILSNFSKVFKRLIRQQLSNSLNGTEVFLISNWLEKKLKYSTCCFEIDRILENSIKQEK